MPSFKDIPFELVTSIAQSIDDPSFRGCSCIAVKPRGCHKCRSTDTITLDRYDRLADESKAPSQTLAALCLTSRRLNAAATCALYRRPATYRWWLLARTLLARPDLARLVEDLCFPNDQSFEVPEAAVSVEVLAYYRAKRETHIAKLSDHARHHYNCDLGSGVLNADNKFEQTISVVASLCPAVKTLEAWIGYGAMFHFCAPVSMLALHTVEVAHYDSRYGMGMKQMVPLFKAAPNLKIVRCRSMSDDSCGDPDFTLLKLTTLDLQEASIHKDALRAWLVACPNLETFLYEAGAVGWEQFSPNEALEVLKEHGRKLQKVVLDMTTPFNVSTIEDWPGWGEDADGELQRALDGFSEWGVQFELLGELD